ncbi:MAG: PAS domain S-box protein [Sphingomonas sp.]|nr:PAS domain S-box protein [Sphingomonas sp.]
MLDAHLAAIVDSSFDAIISKDLDGIIRIWNPAAERIFGWTAAEMIGRSIRTLIPADRQLEEDEIIARISAGEQVPKFETWRLHKQGHLIPLSVTVSPIRARDGCIIGASQIAHDIAGQIYGRSQLELSEQRFRALADNIPQLAWMAEGDGSIFWYNQRWYDYTGTDLAAMQGWGWETVHHPDHLPRVVEGWRRHLDSGEEWEDTFPLRGTDGEYRWFLSRAKPIRDEEGQVRLWFGTNTDITDQRDHEQQIQLLMREMSHRAKNLLSLVQAIVHQTAGRTDSSFVAQLDGRLVALAANQDLMVRRDWTNAPLADLLHSQLAYVQDLLESRIDISGPEVHLVPAACEVLGLAIHELATNATKYGALSNDSGRVSIDWAIVDESGTPSLRLRWVERGGPPVTPPTSTGFGTMIIARNPRHALNAKVETRFDPEGIEWTLTAALDRVQAS